MREISESDIAALAAKIEEEELPRMFLAEGEAASGYNEATAVAVIDCVQKIRRICGSPPEGLQAQPSSGSEYCSTGRAHGQLSNALRLQY